MKKDKKHTGKKIFELDGIKIIDEKLPFKPGRDSLFLARLADVRKGERILEIGSGSGFISVYLAAKKGADVTGVELFERLNRIAQKVAEINGVSVEFITGDAKKLYRQMPPSSFDAIVSNPPYIPAGEGRLPPSPEKQAARHEIHLTIRDVASISKRLLKPDGRVWIAFPTHRLAECITVMHNSKLHTRKLFLITGEKNLKPDIFIACFRKKKGPVDVEIVPEK